MQLLCVYGRNEASFLAPPCLLQSQEACITDMHGEKLALKRGKRVWDRMQKGRQQKRMEIEKLNCTQIDTFAVYLRSVLAKTENPQKMKMNYDRHFQVQY